MFLLFPGVGSLEEFKSVLAGGSCQGWLPDVSVILWRRMLGALGDVNKIEDPAIHASVFEHLCDLQETLIRVSGFLQVYLSLCYGIHNLLYLKLHYFHASMTNWLLKFFFLFKEVLFPDSV